VILSQATAKGATPEQIARQRKQEEGNSARAAITWKTKPDYLSIQMKAEAEGEEEKKIGAQGLPVEGMEGSGEAPQG
jgi:hypothetical protein